MRSIVLVLGLLATGNLMADNLSLKTKIGILATSWEVESKRLTEYVGLSGFCMDEGYRNVVHTLLNEIHHFHGILYEELKATADHHDQKKLRKVLNEIEKIEEDYNIESFNDFFRERCYAQQKLEKRSDHYKAGFGVHSYYGKIYVLEEELYRYLKRFEKSIFKIKKHMKHLHIDRIAHDPLMN